MAELEQSSAEAGFKSKEIDASAPARSLDESIALLSKFGGFQFIESLVDGAQNLNPERKARKNIFLTEPEKKGERDSLKKKLEIWMELLSTANGLDEIASISENKALECEKLLNSNLKKITDSSKELETSYRSVALFYKNAESDKINNVSIMNASLEQMSDLDDTRFIDYVSEELKQNYDRLDLRDNYSILCIPGYLGSKKVINKWAKIAHETKVMLVTDFDNLNEVDATIDDFKDANLTGGDIFLSNVVMTGNWLVGRGKNQTIGEDSDLFVPPSSSLAGRMYTTLMSQVSAGSKFGTLNEVDGVRFAMKKSEISEYDKNGLVPMVSEYGKVMAFSAKTLFNGDNLGLQTYSVVRVFDYINKVLIDFLNRRAFENWTSLTEKDLREQIVKFLDSITGPKSLIEKFRIDRFERDDVQKDKIHLDIFLLPYFPAKSFMLKLDGTKGNFDTATNQM
jgi:hypothetical protein